MIKKPPDRKKPESKTVNPFDNDETRQIRRHRQKKRIVRDIWIYSGILICFMPLNLQVTLLLATTFLSFMVLDETP